MNRHPPRAHPHWQVPTLTRHHAFKPPLALGLAGLWLLALAAPRPVRAGAWTAAPGALYARLSYGASSANDQFGFGGQTRPIVDGITDYPFADRSLYAYGEYGLRDRLTLIGQAAFKRVFVHDRLFRYQTTGLGDVGVGVRYRVVQHGAWVGSVSGLLSVPTGYSTGSRPPLGAGAVDLVGGFEVGRSFYPRPGYATGGLAWAWRSSATVASTGSVGGRSTVNYADQLRYRLETGWTIRRRLTLSAVLHGVHALHADGSAFTITSIPSSERYLKLGVGAAYGITPHFDVSAEAGGTPAGRNTARSIDLTLGVATKW